MEKIKKKNIGILGGGQLGLMLYEEWLAKGLGKYCELHFLDQAGCPVSTIKGVNLTIGDFRNHDDVRNFGERMDVVTIEIEDVDIDALKKLVSNGITVIPSPEALETIKDKGTQKAHYVENMIPTAFFGLYTNHAEVIHAMDGGRITYPFVQKRRTGGYDGQGVQIINHASDAGNLFEGPSLVEDAIDVATEVSVIVAKSNLGETQIVCFDPVEMVFDPKLNLLLHQQCPSCLDDDMSNQVISIAMEAVLSLSSPGLFAVEMFVTTGGEILVNEIAPRPHNSGHHTIEAAASSQYEVLLHVLLGLRLPDIKILYPSVLVNLLGEPEHIGVPEYTGIDDIEALKNVYVHLYGKTLTRPGRKMGHMTVVGSSWRESLEDLLEKASQVTQTLKVISKSENTMKSIRPISSVVAEILLSVGAVKLQPNSPFTWASGLLSPIYCDNRALLFPIQDRDKILSFFEEVINKNFDLDDQDLVLAGVATAGIAWGAILADRLKLPFVYVRSSKKKHGTGQQIEGASADQLQGRRVVVIEDLISTGKSSMNAVQTLRDAGTKVSDILAIFSYDFESSKTLFEHEGVTVRTLSDFPSMIDNEIMTGQDFSDKDLQLLADWRANPQVWSEMMKQQLENQ